MTFGPIVEKIAYLPEEYLPTLDKFVDELVAKADKEWDDDIEKGLAEARAGHTTKLDLEEHFKWVDNVCA